MFVAFRKKMAYKSSFGPEWNQLGRIFDPVSLYKNLFELGLPGIKWLKPNWPYVPRRLSMTWYPARPCRITVKYVFVVVWEGYYLVIVNTVPPHHGKEGEINLRNNESVSPWSLPLVWLHVFSNKKGLGLGWNWNRRLLLYIRKKLILSCT